VLTSVFTFQKMKELLANQMFVFQMIFACVMFDVINLS